MAVRTCVNARACNRRPRLCADLCDARSVRRIVLLRPWRIPEDEAIFIMQPCRRHTQTEMRRRYQIIFARNIRAYARPVLYGCGGSDAPNAEIEIPRFSERRCYNGVF